METSQTKIVTCVAPVNIAVIKYWGKANENLIIPLNDSLSGTLSTDSMCAKTTIVASPSLKENKFWLNGKEQTFDNKRLNNCLTETAGLASSAAGYACLVSALAAIYEIQEDVSGTARLGSGSACRSMYGGWVQWCKGQDKSGHDSIAKQIVPASHWPDMRVLILVVSDNKKKDGSTDGMRRSVVTSELLKHRVQNVVPQRIKAITEAIKNKNFAKFAEITMQDSNQFHAICLDTYPPCVYMNDTSHAIVQLVHSYNTYKLSVKVAYTFDAGPNACLYLLEQDVEEFMSLVNYVFPSSNKDEYIRGLPLTMKPVPEGLKLSMDLKQSSHHLKYIIHTKIGEGPKVIHDSAQHLLTETGLPKYFRQNRQNQWFVFQG